MFGTIAEQRLLMSRKVDIAERNPTVFSPRLFQGGADKAPGSQSRTSVTFIAGRNGPQNQAWADHPKATCRENFSLTNSSSAIGPSNYVGGRSAITVLLANCCSLYPKLAELNLLMSSNEPSIIAMTETWLTPYVNDAETSLNNFTVFRSDRVNTHRGGGGDVALYIKSSLQLDIEASHFRSQTTILAVYRSSNSTSSNDLLVLQAIRHVATTPGECLFVSDLPPPLTGQIAHVQNLMGSIKTFSPLQKKNFLPFLSKPLSAHYAFCLVSTAALNLHDFL